MGSFNWLTRRISSAPIAVHFGSDVVRFMQIKGSSEPKIQGAFEVSVNDVAGMAVALSSFKGKRCVACLSAKDVLVQHIRVEVDEDEQKIRERLLQHDARWANAEIRNVCVKTTGSGSNSKQELLCVGIDRTLSLNIVENLEAAGAEVIAVTVPLYASIRAFDKLYRREGDEKITSMLIDMDEQSSMVMIAHGANCVFAHRLDTQVFSKSTNTSNQWISEAETTAGPAALPISTRDTKEFERRNEESPRGLQGMQANSDRVETPLTSELERCLRHHDALFPDRVVDRVIFTGRGANNTEYCSSIATELGISGFVADPAEWLNDDSDLAGGPSWTTAAGLCLRYSENAA